MTKFFDKIRAGLEQRVERAPLLDLAYQGFNSLLRRGEPPNLQALMLQGMLRQSLAECEPPVGVAKEVLADPQVERALAGVPHLGSLAELVDVSATRFDYVRLWIDVLAKIKRAYPGLGLSSPYNRRRGRRGLTRLEVLQLWVVLANCGHLFRTFATERALLYIFSKRSDERREFMQFLSSQRGEHPKFEERCSGIIDRGDYLSFFYVLAAWRIFAGDLKGILKDRKVKAAWRLYFETYGEGDENARMLHWLFRKSRQIVTAYGQSGGEQQLEAMRGYFTVLGDVERLSNAGGAKCWVARITQKA